MTHRVVVNDEEQYSLWPADRPVPAGWRDEGFRGTADECIAHVDATWTDMRPLSLRRQEAAQQETAQQEIAQQEIAQQEAAVEAGRRESCR